MKQSCGRAMFNSKFEYKPLRKPHNREENTASSSSHITSVLSPDAPEFIPQSSSSHLNNVTAGIPHDTLSEHIKNISIESTNITNSSTKHPTQNLCNTHSVQDRLKIAIRKEIQDVPTATFNPTENYIPDEELTDHCEEEKLALDYTERIISKLNENPGLYDSIATRVASVFEGFGDNEFVLSNAMEMIFNKSIEEPNFRYMGAKLYGLLDCIAPQSDSVFRNLLNLKLTYHQTEMESYTLNEQHKIRGTALFLAELYMQLRNNGKRVREIAQKIIFTINQLLQLQIPENIKCVCFTLKLAGYDLETDLPKEALHIIEKLYAIKGLDVSTSRILETVFNLQKNNWGRNESVGQIPLTNDTSKILNNDPIFYGPDGQVITEEENHFLESNIPYEINHDEDSSDSDEIEVDPEMDTEMQIAYRDFLKSSTNNTC